MLRLGLEQVLLWEREMVLSTISTLAILYHSHRKLTGFNCSCAMLKGSSGRFIEYMLGREDVVGPWKEHTEHDFVRQIGDGTLPVGKFKMYLIQDYLYLVSGSLALIFVCARGWY